MDVELADKKDMMKQRGFHIRVKSILLSECCAETCEFNLSARYRE